MISFILLIFSSFLLNIECQVSVLGPPELASKLKNYEIGSSGSNQLIII